MLRLFLRHSLRYFARHRTLTAASMLGIALGVAVFVSVQIINQSALHSFRASVDIVAGRANLEISADGLPFDETSYVPVRQHPGVLAATPVVQAVCLLPDFPGEFLQLLGIDVFSNGPLRTYQFRNAHIEPAEALAFIKDTRAIALNEKLARRLGLKVGNSLALRTPRGVEQFHIGFLLHFDENTPGADEHVAVMDLANVQENFGLVGKLTRIDCRLREDANAATIARDLQPSLPGNVTIKPPDRRGAQIERMIGAFQLNLIALSLVSLLVGLFLIYNTVSAAVVRRRAEIGLLRALGLTPAQVQGLFLAEAALLGLAGTALGLIGGILLAEKLIGAVSQTITSIYILLRIQEVFVSPWLVLGTLALGLGAVLAAAWIPAQEAARIAPVEALSLGHLTDKRRRATGPATVAGIGFLLLAALCAGISLNAGATWNWLSFGAALGVLLALASFVPGVSTGIVALLQRLPLPTIPRLALGQFAGSLHRNTITIAALVTALAMVVGISVMIFSFRTTVQYWLDRSVVADVFVAPASSLVIGHRQPLRPEVESVVAQSPLVLTYDRYREVRMSFRGDQVKLAAIRFSVNADHNRLVFKEGDYNRDGERILREAAARGETVVSEAFARKFGVHTGDLLPLATPKGVHEFRIAGVFYDYTTEFGLILLDQDVYRAWWNDFTINSLAIHLKPGVTAEAFQNDIRPRLAPLGEYLVFSNRELRVQIFRIFDQTFTVTNLLQVIGITVSGLGIFLSLLILVNERAREIGILRAVGASRPQVMAIILSEATLVAVIGIGMGLTGGLGLAWILVHVINTAFFDWSIEWATPGRFLLELPIGVLIASLAAAWWPAYRASRIDIANAVKLE